MSIPVLTRPAAATPGDLDGSFRRDGTLVTNITPWNENVGDMAIQRNGKIVVVGRASTRQGYGRFAVVRYGTRATGSPPARPSLLQPDGRIVVAGQSWTESAFDGVVVLRYEPEGVLDEAFGVDGVATAEFTAGTDGGGDGAGGIALHPDGKIVIAGDAGGAGEYTSRFGLARFGDDGVLDTTFGDDGLVRTNFTRLDDSATDLAIQADGSIVAVGAAGFGWGSLSTFALARYEPDGSLDDTFGDGGKLRTRFGGAGAGSVIDILGAHAAAVELQPEGRIVVAGDVDRANDDRLDGRFAVARYLA